MTEKKIVINSERLDRIKSSLTDELWSIFEDGCNEMDDMVTWLDNFDEKEADDFDTAVYDSLKVYCIIRLVTILETIFRRSFEILIDEYDKDFKVKIETSLKDLKSIQKEQKITNGKIISDGLNFQKLESSDKDFDIFKIFSMALDVPDFYSEMINVNNTIPQIRNNITNLIKERHKVTHELLYTKYSVENIIDEYKNVADFIIVFSETVKKLR